MKKKTLSIVILFAISLLFLPSVSTSIQTSPITDAWFRFTVQTAGSSGTLTFYQVVQGIVYDPISWSATSGDNNPDHQNRRGVGPIPEGRWSVYPEGSENVDETNPPNVPFYYPLYWVDVPNRSDRDGFYVHQFITISRGCICIHGDDDWVRFMRIVDVWFEARGFSTIRLIVDYPDDTNATGVGGVVIPIDKFGLLAPYIRLASATMIAAVAAVIYVKGIKRRKEKQ